MGAADELIERSSVAVASGDGQCGERIEMKKYCKWDRTHTLHKETR